MTSRASGSSLSNLKDSVLVMSLEKPGCWVWRVFSCFRYVGSGKMCHAYSASPSEVVIEKGVTWFPSNKLDLSLKIKGRGLANWQSPSTRAGLYYDKIMYELDEHTRN